MIVAVAHVSQSLPNYSTMVMSLPRLIGEFVAISEA